MFESAGTCNADIITSFVSEDLYRLYSSTYSTYYWLWYINDNSS